MVRGGRGMMVVGPVVIPLAVVGGEGEACHTIEVG